MAYSQPKKAIALRAMDLEHGVNGPGLYENEVAVDLDGLGLVGVAVIAERLDNGGGVSLLGEARLIEPDGSSKVCGHGKVIHSGMGYTADSATVARFTLPVLTKEVMLALLGEPLTVVDKPNPTPDESHPDPVITEPIVVWSEDILLNASIRHAALCADEATTVTTDAATILFG